MPGWAQGLKLVGKGFYKIMPKTAAGWVGSYVGYNIITGHGVDGAIKGALSPDMQQSLESGDGALKPIVNGVLDENNIDALKEEMHDIKESAKEAAQSARDHTVDAYNAAKEAISDAMHRQGTDAQGMSPEQMQQYQQMQQYAQYGQYGQGGNGLMNWLTGNGFDMRNSASIIGGLWLLFGRFNWVGKLLGALLGTWGTQNLMNRRQQIQAQQIYPVQPPATQATDLYYQNEPQRQNPTDEVEDNHVIRRR